MLALILEKKGSNMTYESLRDWIAKIEEAGELKRITAEVDWDLEPEEQYGGKREPLLCMETPSQTAELIN